MLTTSTSSLSMTPSTTPKLSMKPLTATLSMRFVLALYSVRSTVLASSSIWSPALCACPSAPPVGSPPVVLPPLLTEEGEDGGDGIRVKDRRTRGESSASTCRDRSAELAKRWEGKGVEIMLVENQPPYGVLQSVALQVGQSKREKGSHYLQRAGELRINVSLRHA